MRRLPVLNRAAGEASPNRLSYAQALESPCADCATSPCCSYLPLHTFQATTLVELDYAVYLLNFDRIELGLSGNGDWSAYYRYPCRFLSPEDFRCAVHQTPRQPNICVNYNPYSCWYKRVLTKSVSPDFVRIDRARLQFILDRIVFDDERKIVEGPSWETLVEEFTKLPPPANDRFDPPPTLDPVSQAWERLVLDGGPFDSAPETHAATEDAIRDPCHGCGAYCCKTVSFPQSAPTTASQLDYLRFCLGFPGIEVGVADGGWSLLVRTTCRHLVDNRCGLYGQPERPLRCKYYDAWKCQYKPQLGVVRPEGFFRVKLEQFAWLEECFEFDATGNVVQELSTEAIRDHVEARLRESRVNS